MTGEPTRFFEEDGRTYSEILDPDLLPPFLLTIVSASDLWMFLSSTGALTAGRGSAEGALFPYTTEDKLHDAAGITGPVTRVALGDGRRWRPLDPRGREFHDLERRIALSTSCDSVVFEERCPALGLRFRTRWEPSEEHGWVRRSELTNEGSETRDLRVVDGLTNLMPADANLGMQSNLSVLLDAYRLTERVADAPLAAVRLSSIPIDRPEPNESLRANTVFALAPEGARTFLEASRAERFLGGEDGPSDDTARGVRASFHTGFAATLAPDDSVRWTHVLDVNQSGADVVALRAALRSPKTVDDEVTRGLASSRAALETLLCAVDAPQATGDPAEDARHRANALFNAMRGGVVTRDGRIDVSTFVEHVAATAKGHVRDAVRAVSTLAPVVSRRELLDAVSEDSVLQRLAREFLPLTFSRRHGDPSRPWNAFRIPARYPNGEPCIGYEGNWRDIFQNWEALTRSFPAYAPAAVARFLNASTADGYNPYRIDLAGVDWELHDPDDPWSFIGYWGDHQVVYLARLVDLAERHAPGTLSGALDDGGYVFVDVPYRIKGFDHVLADPHATVDFDHDRAAEIERRVQEHGNEGRLLAAPDGAPVTVTLAEKLLTPLLVKLTNLVPGGGVWMNTQRPEWNDANNAIAGLGVSVVTTAHLHAALEAWSRLFAAAPDVLWLSPPLAALVRELGEALAGEASTGASGPAERQTWTERLGRIGERHRAAVYAGASAKDAEEVPSEAVRALLGDARRWTEATLRANEREDGLFHAYNLLLRRPDGGLGLRRLALMLEGQVAVLGSGLLSPERTLELLRALRASELWRADRGSYVLYPNRALPTFLERGRLPDSAIEEPFVQDLLERHALLRWAPDGSVRFAPELRNRAALEAEIVRIDLDAATAKRVLALYEEVFDHEAFPGRSQTFFGYEGLGCIYWHMVSKLCLAVQETLEAAEGATFDALVEAYTELRAGIGTHLSPAEYGSFPTVPYSHTPERGGARQPGLTGQVKEDVLARFGELGVQVEDGCVTFRSTLGSFVQPCAEDTVLAYRGKDGAPLELDVPAGSLAFTYCGVPVLLGPADGTPRIRVRTRTGELEFPGRTLDARTSADLFLRGGEVERIEVHP